MFLYEFINNSALRRQLSQTSVKVLNHCSHFNSYYTNIDIF